jgi:GPH family glycoside/pentoside/hexuronide:cation symporter
MMNESITETEFVKSRHSTWKFFSNASSQLCRTLITSSQASLLFFYQVIIGLEIGYVILATGIFAVYNAVNDPIIGFLVDRNFKFTRKWGRRFPWILVGIIPWAISLYLLFSAPDLPKDGLGQLIDPWPAFWWLLLSLLLLDTFGTLVIINYDTLRPDMFRTEGERRRFSKYYTPMQTAAIALGLLLPGLFIPDPGDPGARASFSLMGAVVAIVALIFAFLSLPGNREDKIIIDRYYSGEYKRMSFFNTFGRAITSRSFMVLIVFTICYHGQIALVTNNMLYLTTFVLQLGGSSYVLILAMYMLGTIISFYPWLRLLKKYNNNKKAFLTASFATVLTLFPLTFFIGFYDLLIWALILGLASGGLAAYTTPIILSSVTDDFVIRIGKNIKGLLFGIAALIGRLTSTFDEVIVGLVQGFTGFIAGQTTYVDLTNAVLAAGGNMSFVLLGIRLIQGVIPALVLLIGTLVFWKWFPLSQDKVLDNKAKLKELGF